jgi:NAD(P)-dependent dehydrogenase (short-subunit alcohol dehydrogenase family)
MHTPKTWFITGSSRGLGAEAVRAALAHGDRVVATSRDLQALRTRFSDIASERLLLLSLDVADAAQAESAVAAAIAHFGTIDVLLNNAGYGQLGVFEEISAAAVEQQFATNFFGLLHVTRAVLPVMRAQGAGRILNISSVGGIQGGPFGSIYCASKFAIEGFSESLAGELAGLGIAVTVVGPGFFRTEFLGSQSVRFGEHSIPDYAPMAAELGAFFSSRNGQQAGDPAKLAEVLVALAHHAEPPLRFSAGSDAVEMLRAKLDHLRRELDAFEPLSRSTDLAPGA